MADVRRSSFRPGAFAAVIVLTYLGPICIAHAQSEEKQVLVLYSTRRDAQLSIIGEGELPRMINAGPAQDLGYHSEFIDATTFPEYAYDAFREFLRLKYQGQRFDLIVAIQEGAIEFVNAHRGTLFRDTPVVFLTNNPAISRLPDSTGLILERDFGSTLALLRQLQPDVRQVFIVTGAAAEKQYENAIRQLEPSEPELTFTYLSGLAAKDLEDRLSRLPEHSAVYYISVSEDGAGQRFHPLRYLDRVAAAANAPTYCWTDSAMGHGIIGGSLYHQKDAIEGVGQLALRVLRGEPADSIPMGVLDTVNTNEVDWRQLRRWRIDEARVPLGTVVRFRDPTIWDRYRIYILAALTLLITQTVLMTGLLIQRTRRRRAEEELLGRERELRTSHERNRDLGVRLLKAQETERARIARELHDDICQRMSILTIDLELVARADRNQAPAAEALTVARDIATSLHELSHRLHPTRLRLLGLVDALDHLCVEMSRAGVAISFTHDNVPSTLPTDLMLCLFRVVQEAAQNAIKYSEATELSVQLRGGPDGLTLTIIDKGVGFDLAAAWGKGVGLVSMIERLEAIGGSLEISSNPGAGTRVTATVPPHAVPGAGAMAL